jgi:hypothetical protein
VSAAPDPAPVQGEDPVAAELRRLREQVAALQAEMQRLADGGPPARAWEEQARPEQPSYAWLSSLGASPRRRPAVPRFLLEAAFIVAAAALAAAADLEPLLILGVMAAAWAIVALAELAASRAERRRDDLLVVRPVASAQPSIDAAWFSPPVEHTMLEGGASTDAETAVTRLPPAPDEATVERRGQA